MGNVRQVGRPLAAARRARDARVRADEPQHPEPAAQPPAGVARAADASARRRSSPPAPAWPCRSRGSASCCGIPTIYVESVTRIEGLSLSARMIRPVAAQVYAQWPELAEPSAGRIRFAGNLFAGPMILVTVGTHEQQFDRLVEAAAALGGDEQHAGPVRHVQDHRTARGEWIDFMSFDELAEHGAPRPRGGRARRRRLDRARAPLRAPPDHHAAPPALRRARRRAPDAAHAAAGAGRDRHGRGGRRAAGRRRPTRPSWRPSTKGGLSGAVGARAPTSARS